MSSLHLAEAFNQRRQSTMSRNVFQKSSDDDGEPKMERVEFSTDQEGGELPYLKLLCKILDKVSPHNNNNDKTPHLRVVLHALGLILAKDKTGFERLCSFIAVNASAYIEDGDLNLADAPEGFTEMREKIKDALLEEAKQKAEGKTSDDS